MKFLSHLLIFPRTACLAMLNVPPLLLVVRGISIVRGDAHSLILDLFRQDEIEEDRQETRHFCDPSELAILQISGTS